ncbi:MAG: hypothetical protein H6739_14335 [Alphaproteobacteria bacterium]|nr:hypothetical protein [Alphaproteobacteria bacterium]
MSYTSWQDLLDDEEQPSGGGLLDTLGERAGAVGDALVERSDAAIERGEPMTQEQLDAAAKEELLNQIPGVATLMQERKGLESKMRALLGQGDDDEGEDPRRARQFPVLEHTPESRILDRQLAKRDEDRHIAQQHRLALEDLERREGETREAYRRRRRAARAARRREQQRAQQRAADRKRSAFNEARTASRWDRLRDAAALGRALRERLEKGGRDAADADRRDAAQANARKAAFERAMRSSRQRRDALDRWANGRAGKAGDWLDERIQASQDATKKAQEARETARRLEERLDTLGVDTRFLRKVDDAINRPVRAVDDLLKKKDASRLSRPDGDQQKAKRKDDGGVAADKPEKKKAPEDDVAAKDQKRDEQRDEKRDEQRAEGGQGEEEAQTPAMPDPQEIRDQSRERRKEQRREDRRERQREARSRDRSRDRQRDRQRDRDADRDAQRDRERDRRRLDR